MIFFSSSPRLQSGEARRGQEGLWELNCWFSIVFTRKIAFWFKKCCQNLGFSNICEKDVRIPRKPWTGGPPFSRNTTTFFANVAKTNVLATFFVWHGPWNSPEPTTRLNRQKPYRTSLFGEFVWSFVLALDERTWAMCIPKQGLFNPFGGYWGLLRNEKKIKKRNFMMK